MRPEAQAWWDEAEAELEGARHLLESEDYHLCAFFCQQAVEKALKALWIYRRKEMAPKIHDITELAARLDAPGRLHTALKELNPLFATTRYPDAANGVPARMYDQSIAQERLGDAEEVMAWCRSELGQS
jgi:HEPN domain-containing protein